MREILFKAKLKDWQTNPQHDIWVEGFYLSRKETTYCFKEDYEKFPVKTLHFIAEDCMTDWGLPNDFRLYEIDPDTLCQHTGMVDKNGNAIWENDVVEFESIGYIPNTQTGQVAFYNGSWCIRYLYWGYKLGFHRIGSVDSWQEMGASGTITYEYKKVGNIFDDNQTRV